MMDAYVYEPAAEVAETGDEPCPMHAETPTPPPAVGLPVAEIGAALSSALGRVEELGLMLTEAKDRASIASQECVALVEIEETLSRSALASEHATQCRWLEACADFEQMSRAQVARQESRSWQQLVSRFLQGVVPRFQLALAAAVVRSAPSVDSRKTLRQLRKDVPVQVEEVAGNWVRISVPVKGWVWRTHLKPSPNIAEGQGAEGHLLPECVSAPPTVSACTNCGQWNSGTPPSSCRSCGSHRADSLESTLASSMMHPLSWSPSSFAASIAEMTPGPSRHSFNAHSSHAHPTEGQQPCMPTNVEAVAEQCAPRGEGDQAEGAEQAMGETVQAEESAKSIDEDQERKPRAVPPLALETVVVPPAAVPTSRRASVPTRSVSGGAADEMAAEEEPTESRVMTQPVRTAPGRPQQATAQHPAGPVPRGSIGAVPLAVGDAVEVRDYLDLPWLPATVAKLQGGRVLVQRDGFPGMASWAMIRRQDYSIFTRDGTLATVSTPTVRMREPLSKGDSVVEVTIPRNGCTRLGIEFLDDSLVVRRVDEAMPAGQAGMRPGSRIVAVDGHSVRSLGEMRAALRRCQDSCRLTVVGPMSPSQGPPSATSNASARPRSGSWGALSTPQLQGQSHPRLGSTEAAPGAGSPTGSPVSSSSCGSSVMGSVVSSANPMRRADGYGLLPPQAGGDQCWCWPAGVDSLAAGRSGVTAAQMHHWIRQSRDDRRRLLLTLLAANRTSIGGIRGSVGALLHFIGTPHRA